MYVNGIQGRCIRIGSRRFDFGQQQKVRKKLVTVSRAELIKKLLLTNHLSDSERQNFNDSPVTYDEVMELIKEELNKHRFFPPVTDIWDNSKFYKDGLVIEKRGTEYVLHEQQSGATMNLLFDSEQKFNMIDEVIERYIRSGNQEIDGIRIVG